MKLTKKTLIYIVAGVLAAALLTFGTIFVLKMISDNDKPVPTLESADSTKTKAIEALKNEDKENAKKLFEEAKAEYEAIGDTDNVIDTEAQLFLLNAENNQ